jgi:pyruvate formate lyase activating enzyme
LAPVLETLVWLRQETDVWIEVTTLLIPGENDSEGEIEQLCGWFREHLGPEVPLHFTAFHPDFRMNTTPATPTATLRRARGQALAAGLKHVYTGNVVDPQGQSTWCAGCGRLLVERSGYEVGGWNLDAAGRCRFCGRPVVGRYDPEPGVWGSRRQRVRISGN